MKGSISAVLLTAGLLGVPAGDSGASAQDRPLAVCSAPDREKDPFLVEVARARDLASPGAAEAALAALDPEARRSAAESPDDAAAQYRLAAVLGARLDFEHGTGKMAGAEAVHDQAVRVLELDPRHPGASYMLGKIHASVLRMGGFKRFLAGQLFGSRALKEASWDKAQALLEVAAREDPCVPEHHFELARVYVQRGDTAAAEREFGWVRELTAGNPAGREALLRERAEEMERELSEGNT